MWGVVLVSCFKNLLPKHATLFVPFADLYKKKIETALVLSDMEQSDSLDRESGVGI